MPAHFADILTTAGLVSLTVLIVALLKAIPAAPDAAHYKASQWVKANQFITSIVVAGSLAAVAYAVQIFDLMPYAEKYWQGWLFLWAAAQALYNGQKGLSHVLKGQSN